MNEEMTVLRMTLKGPLLRLLVQLPGEEELLDAFQGSPHYVPKTSLRRAPGVRMQSSPAVIQLWDESKDDRLGRAESNVADGVACGCSSVQGHDLAELGGSRLVSLDWPASRVKRKRWWRLCHLDVISIV